MRYRSRNRDVRPRCPIQGPFDVVRAAMKRGCAREAFEDAGEASEAGFGVHAVAV